MAQSKKDAYLSRELATIKCDVNIEFDLAKARFGRFDQEKLAELFNELEFRSLLPRLQGLAQDTEKQLIKTKSYEPADKFKRDLALFNYSLVDDDKKFTEFIKKLKAQKEFTFDTETANFNPLAAELLGISFSWKTGEAYYINFQFSTRPNGHSSGRIFNFQLKNADLFNYQKKKDESRINQEWLDKLKPIFEDEKIKKYGHNIKFDVEVMASLGMKVKGVVLPMF
ncbi:MAG: hypothetical protein HYV53_03355 [Parcubacteria group bacterium]|nr:hypothetical protein [Parcubacteria group bacterium]